MSVIAFPTGPHIYLEVVIPGGGPAIKLNYDLSTVYRMLACSVSVPGTGCNYSTMVSSPSLEAPLNFSTCGSTLKTVSSLANQLVCGSLHASSIRF